MHLLPRLFLLLALATAPAFAADAKPAHAAHAAHASATAPLTGEFTGEWRAQNDASGALRLTFAQGKDGTQTVAATFTYEGTDIPTKTKFVRVEGQKVELAFSWRVQDVEATSTLKGELKGDVIEGAYESPTSESAGVGKWKVTRAKS